MNKLLSAEFARLFKSAVFRLALGFSAGLAAAIVVIRYLDVKKNADIYAQLGVEYSNADGLIFVGGIYLIFAVAVFIGIFTGTEYSDGTIRNKLTALLLLLSMSIQNKAAGSVVCLLAAIIMMFGAITIYQKVTAPEFYEAYSYIDEETGKTITREREKNPNYLTGTKREVYVFLNDFLPFSQMYQIMMNNPEHLRLIVLYDCVLIVITTGTGLMIFRKMNLK